MTSFVIIGAGECGARAALILRERGFAGNVTLIGSEALLPYERPPLSKATLLQGTEPKWIAEAVRYEELGIAVRTGITAIAVDRRQKAVQLSDGTTLDYDKLLLTTGARPRELGNVASPRGHIRALRTHSDASALRPFLKPGRSIAILGGGFIGLELAASARTLGASVILLEGLSRILSRGVPAEIATRIAERHAAEGVDIRCGVKILSVEETNAGVLIDVVGAGVVAVDVLVVGIGAVPNTELAAAAGLAIENGIAVNSNLRTSDPDIFAAGDCCSFPSAHFGERRLRLESWRNAQEQGVRVAASMMGETDSQISVPWFWSDQYDLTLQVAGLADGATAVIRRDLSEDAFILFHLDADGRILAASGIGPGNSVARDIRLAEMLIAAGRRPDPKALANSQIKLKQLLAA
ncbi:NAD(P)/FAD-dependent oxidoreductase [Rhizobium multihospitium]|uniref:3-phenylpropionate/trans-cinnamate dioxygenase ferredoxin reductase subunit n=1 Tax=Rhizobium multihospitium TaxID=410764 RepID=A0A1C3WVT2_9HYPH|nr:FAD-dependent oxidoreductase [Rhizobium multihospitium]SCB44137.1 3-phenylpropionate/trans-cinnamate dioxygenase ferredoxin reductase subunit [Rhizobium multihospitium]